MCARHCNFEIDAALIEQEFQKTQSVLGLLGLNEERLVLARLPRGDGSGFVKRVTNFIKELEQTMAASSR
jgi:coenzyme F420-reducing hydrogenase delta subunit